MSDADRRATLLHHNKVRAEVGVAPLKWSPDLAAYAQEWADKLAAYGCRMAHRTGGRFGENLFQGSVGVYSALDASKAWEGEKALFKGEALTRSNFEPIGHYTQMVWRGSSTLGCGEAICDGTLIVACNYDPPGNVLGRRPY